MESYQWNNYMSYSPFDSSTAYHDTLGSYAPVPGFYHGVTSNDHALLPLQTAGLYHGADPDNRNSYYNHNNGDGWQDNTRYDTGPLVDTFTTMQAPVMTQRDRDPNNHDDSQAQGAQQQLATARNPWVQPEIEVIKVSKFREEAKCFVLTAVPFFKILKGNNYICPICAERQTMDNIFAHLVTHTTNTEPWLTLMRPKDFQQAVSARGDFPRSLVLWKDVHAVEQEHGQQDEDLIARNKADSLLTRVPMLWAAGRLRCGHCPTFRADTPLEVHIHSEREDHKDVIVGQVSIQCYRRRGSTRDLRPMTVTFTPITACAQHG